MSDFQSLEYRKTIETVEVEVEVEAVRETEK